MPTVRARRCLSGIVPAPCRAVGPFTAWLAAAGGDARFIGIVGLLDRVYIRAADFERLENGARAHTGFHGAFGDKQTTCRASKVTWRAQPAVREMDVRQTFISLPPGFGGAFNVAQDGWCHCFPVGRSQQCEDPRFLTAQVLQPTWSLCPQEYRAGAQHEPVRRDGHYRVHWHGAFSRAPFVTQPFLQHVSSPWFNGEYVERRGNSEPRLAGKS